MLRSPLLYPLKEFHKFPLVDQICNIFGMSNVINAVIDPWDGKCVRFCDRIYFRVVRTHAKSSIRFWHKNTRRTPLTLTRFYKVIVQQILYFFPEILLFYRIHSVWMLFHRFRTFNNVNIMIDFISSEWIVRK